MTTNTTTKFSIDYHKLLETILSTNGKMISQLNTNFWNYSLLNCYIAMFQCEQRGQEFGQLATYKQWKELGRQVKKGEKAICMRMPITFSKENESSLESESKTGHAFIWRNNWFTIHQTELLGEAPIELIEIASDGKAWNRDACIEKLGLKLEQHAYSNLNFCYGYAKTQDKVIGLNPFLETKAKMLTFFHEAAHCLLHHGEEGQKMGKAFKEVEAELTAYIVTKMLGFEVNEVQEKNSLIYIRDYMKRCQKLELPLKRCLKAADQIVRAGRNDDAKKERLSLVKKAA